MTRQVISQKALMAVVILMGLFMANQAQETVVSDICLGCICEAVSGCNLTQVCNGGACGLFHITRPYWMDGGSLTIDNEDPDADMAYENCANDPTCAGNTVQAYMREYRQDCNDDGIINCYDYAAIHTLGGFSCKEKLNENYSRKLTNCLQKIFQLTDIKVSWQNKL